MTVSTFDAIDGIRLEDAKDELSFGVLRENVISEDHSVSVGRDSVLREDTMEPLGIISKRRGLLPYPTIMEWLTDEFDQTNHRYKLTESVINKKGDMFQSYLFDLDMDNPDAETISPMIIAKASYVGKPLELLFGTYRFVCSNGAIAGNTIESISIKGSEISDLMSHSVRDEISFGIDGMVNVSNKYKELSNEPFETYLNKMITDRKFPTGMKKKSMYKLSDEGNIALTLEEEGIKLKGEHFDTTKPELLYSSTSSKSAWGFYNDMTELATHSTRSVNARSHTSLSISNLFGI